MELRLEMKMKIGPQIVSIVRLLIKLIENTVCDVFAIHLRFTSGFLLSKLMIEIN